jgi:RND family efflux transporter MFP subunit
MLSGCTLVTGSEDPKPELLKPVQDTVQLLEVKRGSIVNELNGVAVLVPRTTTYASFTMDGRVEEVLVKPGDKVRKGDVLIRLDPGTLRSDILNQQVKLENAKLALDNAKLSGDEDTIRIAAMSVDVENLRLTGMTTKLAGLELYAPTDGVVDFVEPGLVPNVSVTGYRELIGIIDPNDLEIKYMTTDSNALNGVELGMEATVSNGSQSWKAKVTQTPRTAPLAINSTQADKNSKTLLLDFVDAPSGVSYGQNVNLSLVISRKDDVVIIPRVALRSYQGRNFVHIQDGDVRREIDVERGDISSTEVEIKKGLREGMKVIVAN